MFYLIEKKNLRVLTSEMIDGRRNKGRNSLKKLEREGISKNHPRLYEKREDDNVRYEVFVKTAGLRYFFYYWKLYFRNCIISIIRKSISCEINFLLINVAKLDADLMNLDSISRPKHP